MPRCQCNKISALRATKSFQCHELTVATTFYCADRRNGLKITHAEKTNHCSLISTDVFVYMYIKM